MMPADSDGRASADATNDPGTASSTHAPPATTHDSNRRLSATEETAIALEEVDADDSTAGVPRIWPIRSVSYPQTPENSEEDRLRRQQRLLTSTKALEEIGSSSSAASPLLSVGDSVSGDAFAPPPGMAAAKSTTTEADIGSVPDIDLFSDKNSEPSHRRYSTNGGAASSTSRMSTTAPSPSIESKSDFAITSRFVHAQTVQGGNFVLTGREGRLSRCEDEPIHAPGAIQGFGALIALDQHEDGRFVVQQVSENSERIFGISPVELLKSKCLSEVFTADQMSCLQDALESMDHRYEVSEDADCSPYNFELSGENWNTHAALHRPNRLKRPQRIILELEPVVITPISLLRPVTPPDATRILTGRKAGLSSGAEIVPFQDELDLSTKSEARPLREMSRFIDNQRNGKQKGMDPIALLDEINDQLSNVTELDKFLPMVASIFKDVTRFDRAMVYQFDESWNGQIVAEQVDFSRTKDLFRGLNFPASDIPPQARELYRINKVRVLYDRDQPTARMCCRTLAEVEHPIDMSHCHLRAISPIHLKYLTNMGVQSTMSISITAFGDLWGLVALHGYSSHHVPFPLRKVCKILGETISHSIERLTYRQRLESRKLINTAVSAENPAGYIVANASDLLSLFEADAGILSIGNEAKTIGTLDDSQELFAILSFLRSRQYTSLQSTVQFAQDYGSLIDYPPGFSAIAGMLVIPLSASGEDFICFFRQSKTEEVSWAGNPYENKGAALHEADPKRLEPRTSFAIWKESVTGKCRAWTEEQLDTGAVLCLVYGRFIAVWREKESAIAQTHFTNLLLANASHEVRTPLNAIINYIELALDHDLPKETRDHLSKSHNASRSLVLTINDLLDLTRVARSGELFLEEPFSLLQTIEDASAVHRAEAERRHLSFDIVETPSGTPPIVLGDQGRLRRILTSLIGNAVKYTNFGGITIEWGELPDTDLDEAISAKADGLRLGISVLDSGIGMSPSQLESLFRSLEQVTAIDDPQNGDGTLGLGLAVASRTLSNLGGQLRVESRQGWGSRFTAVIPFRLPAPEVAGAVAPAPSVEVIKAQSPPRGVPLARIPSANGSAGAAGSALGSLADIITGRTLSSPELGRDGADKNAWRNLPTKPEYTRATSYGPVISPSQSSRLSRVPSLPTPGPAGPATPLSATSRPILGRRALSTMTTDSTGAQSSSAFGASASESMTSVSAGPSHHRASITSIEPASKRARFHANSHDSSPERSPTPAPKRILVVEDEPVNRTILQKRLTKDGHHVVTVEHGGDALRMLDSNSAFDIVLMDLQMPILNGFETTIQIRERERDGSSSLYGRRLPIFAVSASLPERDRPSLEKAGMDGWITKPVNLMRLRELIEGVDSAEARSRDFYSGNIAGGWERGGWLHLETLPTAAA